ncbi:DUF1513 domain-containing protein [Noviherbaspirillum saxi]|nr:DUF1513 domain-containing protein [Noviherbaspirillum saxi]
MVTRRNFLAAAAGLLVLPKPGFSIAPGLQLVSPVSRDGEHFAAGLPTARNAPHLVRLPMRGHGLSLDPRHPDEALIIGRRPGTIAVKVSMTKGTLIQQWSAAEDRHFLGHAVFSRDGDTIFMTENNADSGRGIVSVRDATSFRVLAEYDTHGIGPHELMMMPDGVTLAVANGGIRTLPETGRVKLNRGRIETSLVYLDSRTGQLRGKYVVPSTQQSLRHLAVTPDGRVAAALQFEGDKKTPDVPLMMFHHGESTLKFATAPDTVWNRMRHYAASVAYDPLSDCFALTCPLGDTMGIWSSAGEYLGSIAVPKVSGVAFHDGRGFASNELGEVYQIDLLRLTATRLAHFPGMQWDNHLYLARV